MKVYIGPFITWWGPYQIADLLQHVGVSKDKCHEIGDKLAETPLRKICEWIHSKQKRAVKIKLHPYDTWNMDGTLSMIILPMLKQLKAKKHGAPFTDDEDVPEHLRSTAAPPKENEWDIDALHFDRWDWIFDELIWTFEQIHPDNDWEHQYHSGNIDLFDPSKDTHQLDIDGLQKHQARISNGLRLFGKYYQALWD